MEYKISIEQYSAALKESRLLGLRCKNCGAITTPPRMVCRKCASTDLEICELSGKGKIVTFTTVYVPPANRQGETPYLVIMVEMEEGPWLMGNLAEVDPRNASMELIGKRVRLIPRTQTTRDDRSSVPLFILDEETGHG
ncbi:MAG: Zn-ribbon domain-containing OB-fold protein [Dehalococcoidales bacterium]|jgi:uncharacterized OB-fold protein|nr:Zn-ribbon domain-containing OB-fold protein [Dehalococcoidales bacterium]